jgi:hypothetical protein
MRRRCAAPHRGAWYESPRPRHGGCAADETCGRATPRHAVDKKKRAAAAPRAALWRLVRLAAAAPRRIRGG